MMSQKDPPQYPEIPDREGGLSRIEKLEIIIESGLKSYIAVGMALLEIREAKLYEQLVGYSSFKLYCEERWGMVRRNADRIITSAEIVKNIEMTNQIENHGSLLSEKSLPLPTHERHVRPLFKL